MRIFFDTNAIIGAYLWKGIARSVFETVILDYEPIISEDVINEAKRILYTKFEFLNEELEEFETSIRAQCTVVATPEHPPSVDVRDPDDARILAAAESVNADMLITRDKDLLDLANEPTGVRFIIRPEDFPSST